MKPKTTKGGKTAPVLNLQCPHCEYRTDKTKALRMHKMKKHPAAKEAKDIRTTIANAEKVHPEPVPPLSSAEREAESIKATILKAEGGMIYPESVSETEPAIADVINRQATEQDALINIARYIREKGTTSMKKEVLCSLGVPENAIPDLGGIMFKNRYLIRRVTQGHDLLSVEEP